MAARPSSHTLAIRSRAVAPHPCRPKRASSPSRRAADPCYPAQPPVPFRAKAAARKDASHRFLQPTYSTSTGATARFQRQKALCSTFGAGGGAFDAVPPASTAIRRSPRRLRGEERPTGRGASLVAALSTAQSARSPISDTLVPKSGQARWVRANCAARASSTPVAFDPRCLPSTGAPCARLRRARNPPPFPRAKAAGPASDATPSSLARRRLGLFGYSGLITPFPIRPSAACQFLQPLRFSSTAVVRPSTPRTVKRVSSLAR